MAQREEKRRRRFGFFFLLLSALFYGITPFSVNYIADMGMDTLSFMTFRAWIAVPSMLIIYRCLVPGGRLFPEKRDVPIIIVVGVLSSVLTTFLLYYSFRFVNAGVGETMHYSYPALVILGCFLFRGERLKPGKLLCAVLGLVGVAAFFLPAFTGGISLKGVCIALCSGITYAAFIIISSGERIKKISDIGLVFYMFVVSMAVFSLASLVRGGVHFPASAMGWAALMFSVILQICGMLFFQLGLNRAGPAHASIFCLIEPLTTVILGILFFKEEPTVFTVIGSIVVFASVLLSVIPSKEKKE